MSDIASIHDKLFRSIMADKSIAVDYFRTYLPAFVSQQLDFETLTQLPDVYVSGELKKYMSDLVYSCQTKDGKGDVNVSLLIEHKSYVDKHTPVQVGNYIFSGYLKQLQHNGKLSLIIPILLYHGTDKWEYHTLADLFSDIDPAWKKFLPDFDYIYNNLGEVPDEEIANLDNSFLKALVLVLKYADDEGWLGEHFVELLMLLEDASPNLIRGFFMYLLQQSNLNRTRIIEVMEALPPATKKTMMTFADYFQEKGMEKGIEKGIEKGLEEGIEKGLNQKNREAAINMIRKGYPDEEICEVLDVTPEYVTRMRTEMRS